VKPADLPFSYPTRESNPASLADVPLSWTRMDIEQRLGFRGGMYTQVNNLLTFLIGIGLTLAFYGTLMLFEENVFSSMFTERGITPYFICFFSFWSLAILVIKSRKLALQRRALTFEVLPRDHDFVLSSTTVNDVFDQIHATVDDPRYFVVFNRITIALSNLRNLGRVSDVDEILRSQAEREESSMETSYSLLKGFIWVIPVLGFIGTVLGLSQAIGGFGEVLQSSQQIGEISGALKIVTGGLSTAFETTLEALVAAVVIQMGFTFLKKAEEEFLDACSDYCLRNVVGRLRMMPFENLAD
jgi:biopolymer transport protein ExbB/TolQ